MEKFKLLKANILMVCALFCLSFLVSSCGDDEPGGGSGDEPTATFSTGTIDGLTVSFVNASLRGDSYSWDFGDSNSSTDENPTHTYAADGTYTVTLTVTNGAGSDETSQDITVMEPRLAGFIQGKDWIFAREDVVCYHLGPDDGSWEYDVVTPAPWFNIGDIQNDAGEFICQNTLDQRISAANDVYTFNADGTYNVNWNGDFWGEFGIWAGTDYNEVNIDIVDGALPLRADGVDVSDFIKTTQDYVIDENASTIQVIGSGAHISNPRYKTEQSSHDVGNGITYEIHNTWEDGGTSYMVLRNAVFDNDFSVGNVHYFTFASYSGTTPDVRPNAGGFVPVDFADEVSSADISHRFDIEGNVGSAVDEVTSSSIIDYGQSIDGVDCTKYTRTDADGGFTDFKLWSRDADIRFDDCGTYTFSKAVVDVYVPSSNDFSGALANQLVVKLADESGDDDGGEGGPGFWCCWVTAVQSDLPLDTWTTVTLDFTGALDDADANCGIRDDIDLVILEFGGSNHGESGEVYYSNFRFEE